MQRFGQQMVSVLVFLRRCARRLSPQSPGGKWRQRADALPSRARMTWPTDAVISREQQASHQARYRGQNWSTNAIRAHEQNQQFCHARAEASRCSAQVVAAGIVAPVPACLEVLACCGGVVESEGVGDDGGGNLEDELSQS
jgi:hypothetical protein